MSQKELYRMLEGYNFKPDMLTEEEWDIYMSSSFIGKYISTDKGNVMIYSKQNVKNRYIHIHG